jgi:hypothetical protein
MRIVLAFLLAGCVAQQSPAGGDDDTGTGSGSGSGSGSAAPVASGAYHMRSTIDLTVEVLLPQMAADAVVTLRDFSMNPAQTLLDLAAELGVPAVQEIRDDLPDYVEDKLEGWINGEINKLMIDGVPVPQVAGNIAALAETALTQFALDSELTIDGSSATHTLTAIDLKPAGLDVRVEIATLPADIISATATCSSSKGTLSLGDHAYALQYGEYMWTAINQAVTAKYGSDVRGVIGNAVNCPALAHTIAAKCYWGYCVGHETQLIEICNAGVDEMVERVHDKFSEMRFDAIHLAAGTATVVDANHDGTAEALTGGVWTAEINAGMGLRHAPATFSATK